MRHKYTIKQYIGKRSLRGTLDPKELLSNAVIIISNLKKLPPKSWDSINDLKSYYSSICKSYYQLAASSRRKQFDLTTRKETYGVLFRFRSLIENQILTDFHESEKNIDLENEVIRGRFFGTSSKQGLSIRYSLNSCYPTEECGARCYAHDGRDRELNHLIRGVLNYYFGLKYENSSIKNKNLMIKKLSTSIDKAIIDSIKEQKISMKNGFIRPPRIRFSHIGEMARTPNFSNNLAREIKSRDASIKCVIYTRSPEAYLLDKDLFVVNFTIDNSSDYRLKHACKWMNVVNSAWDGKLCQNADINFLEHHVEKISSPKFKGKICPVTNNHRINTSCDQAKCDKCFKTLS